jgi:phosphate transport system substrate-binding protein
VAQIVKQSPGSIGYVESAYAKSSNLSTALVQNKQGEFVAPSLEAANQALEVCSLMMTFEFHLIS